jgi:trehalose/maltose hydrolase-like predicted phosphorylase
LRSPKAQSLTASHAVTFPVHAGTSYEFVKYVGVDTALTSSSPEASAVAASQRAAAAGWPALLAGHVAAWDDVWRGDVVVK